jgi:cytochrome c biogenesis protein CcmG/thiol:disulfide interchange protein DsbE
MEGSQISPIEETARRRSPVWIAVGVVGAIVVALLGYGLAFTARAPKVGAPVPDFELTAFDGSPMRLSSHHGQVVVVSFFASWCEPCREEAAAIQQTWQLYQDSPDVQFFGIAYKDAASKAEAFLSEFSATYPSTADLGNRIARQYGVTGVPETYVIDQQGNLVRHYLGAITQAQLSGDIDQLLDH